MYDRLNHVRAQTLAREMADALGRTPSNSIFEFESCTAWDCIYNIYFSTPDDYAALDARMTALGKLNLRVTTASMMSGAGPLLNLMNGALDRTRIRGRLIVTSGTYIEPGYSDWFLQNEKNEIVSYISLYATKDGRVSYMFDGKSIANDNIVYLYVVVNPHKY